MELRGFGVERGGGRGICGIFVEDYDPDFWRVCGSWERTTLISRSSLRPTALAGAQEEAGLGLQDGGEISDRDVRFVLVPLRFAQFAAVAFFRELGNALLHGRIGAGLHERPGRIRQPFGSPSESELTKVDTRFRRQKIVWMNSVPK